MIRQLDFQERVMTALDWYLATLKVKRSEARDVEKIAANNPTANITIPDFPHETFKELKSQGKLPASRADKPFSPRIDGCGRHVPNITLKVPTGGGKTWMAVNAVSKIMGQYLGTNNGFVLWIVPNEAIYSQTLKNLKNRDHPYRQALDRTAAGRVKILEKTSQLHANDIESNLCVMLLMLQSSNRQNKESLKMFQERGDVHGFFPAEGAAAEHKNLIDTVRNLDAYDDAFPLVKDTLGNVLRFIRPVVVVDEGQKATSELAHKTLMGFNPCFMLELTATPKDVKKRKNDPDSVDRYANLLVEVTGRELDQEGMIKMPLTLDPRQGGDWRATLGAGVSKLAEIGTAANTYLADTDRYIRPIMLVQVERTGKDQRNAGHIHAEDARDWLLANGFDEAEIAIKTSEKNDLSNPENQDLMARTNRIRVIITKSALQEGWDCPFAYVLCSLSASSNMSAMTQLIGRILRQPYATKTGVALLDECHVVTHHARTGTVVESIKKGLEQDGLGDLAIEVNTSDATAMQNVVRKLSRRPQFADDQIYLPKVLCVDGDGLRDLDYETDIISRLDWDGFDPIEIANRLEPSMKPPEQQLQKIAISEEGEQIITSEVTAKNPELFTFDLVKAVRLVSDIVPNPFIAREIIGKYIDNLKAKGFDDEHLGRLWALLIEELRKGLDIARTEKAENMFKAALEAGDIQFRLRVDGQNWRMPDEIETHEPTQAPQLVNSAGSLIQLSLFEPVYRKEMNSDEQEVAVHLDEVATIKWWHRNVARSQYAMQGWKKQRIYPDFIFLAHPKNDEKRLVVLETKGDHLSGNLDTEYKRAVLEVLTNNFDWDTTQPAGQLQLVQDDGRTVVCELVLMNEMSTNLPPLYN